MLNKAYQELKAKTNALNAELEKVKQSEVSTQTNSEIPEVSNVKQKESEANIEEKKKEIPCKYFHRMKGCRRESKCWFYHDINYKADIKSTKVKQNQTKNFKDKPNVDKELMQET